MVLWFTVVTSLTLDNFCMKRKHHRMTFCIDGNLCGENTLQAILPPEDCYCVVALMIPPSGAETGIFGRIRSIPWLLLAWWHKLPRYWLLNELLLAFHLPPSSSGLLQWTIVATLRICVKDLDESPDSYWWIIQSKKKKYFHIFSQYILGSCFKTIHLFLWACGWWEVIIGLYDGLTPNRQ